MITGLVVLFSEIGSVVLKSFNIHLLEKILRLTGEGGLDHTDIFICLFV
jgi:hypothetical protein